MRAASGIGWVALAGAIVILLDGLLRGGAWTVESHRAARMAGVAGVFAASVWASSEALARVLAGHRARATAIVVSWWCWVVSVHAVASWLAARYRDPELVAVALAMATVVLAWVMGALLHPLVEWSVSWLEHRPMRPVMARCGAGLGLGAAPLSLWAWATPASLESCSRVAAALSRLSGIPIAG